MNQAIAAIIKAQIADLDFIDKIAGLVAVQYMNITNESGVKVQKSYPVACCTTADDCKQGNYNDLAPDSKYKSVTYFEDGGISFDRSESHWDYFTSRLRMVCWLNVKKILEEACDGTCTYSSHAIADIIRHLPEFPQNIAPFDNVYTEVTSQVIRSNSIFAPYTYNELQTQYLMAPYDYFALELTTTFAVCREGQDVYDSCNQIVISDPCPTDVPCPENEGLTDDSGDIIIE